MDDGAGEFLQSFMLEEDVFDNEAEYNRAVSEHDDDDDEYRPQLALSDLEDAAGLTPAARALLRHPQVHDPYMLSAQDRAVLAEALLRLLGADGSGDSRSNMVRYKSALAEDAKYYARIDAQTLKKAAVIGLTTTGAAKHGATLRALGSQVLIVEVIIFVVCSCFHTK